MLNAKWQGFPLGTLAVNLVGGFLIGMALEWFGRYPDDLLKLLLVTGFLGGLTTFSSFSGESLSLLQRGEFLMALSHSAAHVVGSLAAAAAGLKVMQMLTSA
ncbi:CrcB family protein [Roseateles chitinivorans]|uniref:CrcB family protein n=1 Tax=Roseateles chitinivorans TaxID=2917965 RepID=UPI003D66C305